MKYLISVLVPTFNDYEGFLNVLNLYSRDRRVKMIVSDDSSNALIKQAIKKKCIEKNIKYLDGPRSLPSENWNTLLKFIDTPFFVINHHDEYPNNLLFLDLLESKDIGLIILPTTSKLQRKSAHKIYSWQQKIFSKFCLLFPNATFNLFLSPTASLIVNSKARGILFDSNLKLFVDCDWYYRIVSKIKRNKLKIKFWSGSRIISVQAQNSISSSLAKTLKKQISLEKPILGKKGLLPNIGIIVFQYLVLAVILSGTKTKQILYSKVSFIFQK